VVKMNIQGSRTLSNRQITKTTETIPIQRAYDFRFAREADRELTQSAWRP